MKTIEEIYNEMMSVFAGETGVELRGDGDLAVRLYAVAAQVHALYVQGEWVKRQCFPQTAEGSHLDLHAALRGLERRPPAAAVGAISFETDTPAQSSRIIPAGTVCMTAGLARFETTERGILPTGAVSVPVRARALEAGAAGNVDAGAIRAMAVAPVGISRCTNPLPFSGGSDREGDAGLRTRVLETFRRLPNGANAAFYEQGAMSFDQVAAAVVIPRSRGIGTVDVIVATREGPPPAELLAKVKAYFDTRREIAVDLQVKAPVMKPVAVALNVKAAVGRDGAAVRSAVDSAVRKYFDGTLLGKSLLRARLGEVIFAVEGVENYAITAPVADVAVGQNELGWLEALTVEAMT